jgi:hypothetical protein
MAVLAPEIPKIVDVINAAAKRVTTYKGLSKRAVAKIQRGLDQLKAAKALLMAQLSTHMGG